MRTALFFCSALLLAQTPDISGTWVAKRETPMGEMELVWRLVVKDGKISGSQTMGFGEAPIVDGSITGDRFELVLQGEGGARATTKGVIVGETLEITPAMPPRPPGGGMGGPRPGGMRKGGMGMNAGPVVARRGTPTPSFRAPAIADYSKLPKVELPALRAVPWNGLAKTPPMGWNSWNKFRARIDDKTVREMADMVVSTGMRDAGYIYINIDDGWQDKRDSRGVLQPNPGFPDMKSLADYVHSKGLKLGIYSSPGPRTCGGFEGSYGHEETDARMWAEWGIDYLKYDWCSASRIWKDEDMRAVYQRMGEALRKTGRPIVYSLCQYGRGGVGDWGPLVGGNSWRTTFDIRDQWSSMEEIGFAQHEWAKYAGPGHWNDPDMLEIGNGGMTAGEYRTHMSLWAMVASVLMAGNDLRTMSAETKEILMNREVIAVNQDKLGKGGVRVKDEVWVKRLAGGAVAVAVFNRGEQARELSFTWKDVGLKPGKRKMRDLWQHADVATNADGYSVSVPAHGVAMFRVAK